ncbi:MAG TPA: hypothetical protein VGM53_18050 [Streptosporangiaceae bacterium]|jgi:hypothetical protein
MSGDVPPPPRAGDRPRRGDGSYFTGPGEAEEVSFGSWRPRARWRPGWLLTAAAAAVIVAAAIVAADGSGKTGTGKHPPVPPQPAPLAFGMTDVGHPLLDVRAGWELYGYGPTGVARIQFARGRITWTGVPALQSSGPLALLAAAGEVIIRPIDGVPGYVVPDGSHARTLTGALSRGGAVIPGPRPGTAWVQPRFTATALQLTRLDGRGTGVSLRLPPGGPWQVSPDGRGYALLSGVGTGAVYDVRPGNTRRVTGTLVAAGPTRWLVADCHSQRRCTYAVIDTGTGTRRTLPGRTPAPVSMNGVIAPDGSTAAVLRAVGGRLRLHLISLASGADQPVTMSLDRDAENGQTLAWSPDSRWLFAINRYGGLAAVNAGTHRAASLGVALPPLTALAVPGTGG